MCSFTDTHLEEFDNHFKKEMIVVFHVDNGENKEALLSFRIIFIIGMSAGGKGTLQH